jgi:hypothetical protein
LPLDAPVREIRHRWGMRSELVFRSASDGTGWEESWAFSGSDDSRLRAHLARLDRYTTPTPVERWEQGRHVIDAEDRWLAAMLLFSDEVRGINHRFAHPQFRAEQAWTAAGALRLAELLPDEFADLRASIELRFGGAATTS